ncbi:hypothetical protein AAC387_Pa02g4939 [Persea americana]
MTARRSNHQSHRCYASPKKEHHCTVAPSPDSRKKKIRTKVLYIDHRWRRKGPEKASLLLSVSKKKTSQRFCSALETEKT